MELSQLIQSCDRYILEDRTFLNTTPQSEFTRNIMTSIRQGIDVQSIIKMMTPYLININSEHKRSHQLKIGLIVKSLVMLFLVIFIRMLILKSTPDEIWQQSISLDRLLQLAVGVFLTFAMFLILNKWQRFGFSKSNQFKMWELFQDAICLGHEETKFSERLKSQLQDIRRSELLLGTPAKDLKEQLFSRTFAQELFALQQATPKLSYLVLGAELVFFVLASLAFLTMPMLAWVEASQGL